MPLGTALVRRGDVEAGLAAIERARVVASELRDTHELANAMSWMASHLHDAGRYVDAVAAGLEAEAYAARHGLGARWATNALFWTEESLVALGRWEEAGRALDRAEQHELHGAGQLVLETKRLRLATRRGEVRAAARHVIGVQQRASSFSFELTSPVLAEFALWSGDPRAARIAIAAGLAAIDGERDFRVRRLGRSLALGIEAEADLAAGGSPMELDWAKESQSIAAVLLDRMRAPCNRMSWPAARTTRHWRRRCWPGVRASTRGSWRPLTRIAGQWPRLAGRRSALRTTKATR